MTADELFVELRSIIRDLGIRGSVPGEISGSLTYRIRDFMGRAGVPFEPWRGSRQYLSKRGYAIFNGSPGELDVHLAVVDDTNGELCREIAQSLLLVSGWNLLPAYETWTPDRAELEIQKAITRMTLLCDALERGEEPTERTGRDFRFEDWIDGPAAAAVPPVKHTEAAGTTLEHLEHHKLIPGLRLPINAEFAEVWNTIQESKTKKVNVAEICRNIAKRQGGTESQITSRAESIRVQFNRWRGKT